MLRITYVGHATVLLELDGARLLTDPLLRGRVLHLRRSTRLSQDFNRQQLSAVLISHTHQDHFDLPSLERLEKDTLMVLPRGVGGRLSKRGFRHIQECTAGEEIHVGSLTIQATYAEHRKSRFARGPCQDCLGYLVHGTHSVYFAGDTDLFPGMAQIGELNLGVALLPVWGWGPSLGPGHMDPYRAALALRLLKPRLAIPIHWGTLYPLGFIPSWAGFLSDPPHRFAWFAKRLAPEVEVAILQPGESKTVLT
jgi:L-ascorbate metabolism protein UlaG (beta-lactamase superfamily)